MAPKKRTWLKKNVEVLNTNDGNEFDPLNSLFGATSPPKSVLLTHVTGYFSSLTGASATSSRAPPRSLGQKAGTANRGAQPSQTKPSQTLGLACYYYMSICPPLKRKRVDGTPPPPGRGSSGWSFPPTVYLWKGCEWPWPIGWWWSIKAIIVLGFFFSSFSFLFFSCLPLSFLPGGGGGGTESEVGWAISSPHKPPLPWFRCKLSSGQ